MRTRILASLLILALAGCGGADDEQASSGSSSSSSSGSSSSSSSTSSSGGPSFRWERAFGINVGGDEFVSASGYTYQKDRDFVGGTSISTVDAISNTNDDALYQSERYGNYSYQLPVAAGRYRVILKMAEIYQTANAARIFSVSVEGQKIISNMDLYASFGHDVAHDVESPIIQVSDGNLTIDVSATVDNGTLAAIEVFREEKVEEGENPGSVSIGQGIYDTQCVNCHGANGEGSGVFPALTLPSCKSCTSYSTLVAKIESSMPLGGTLCKGSCAADAAAYILATFTNPKPIIPRVARLTHFQWRNAVQDLLYLDAPPNAQVESFSPDAIVGYDTNTAQLRVTSTLRGDYQNAAEVLAQQVASSTTAINRLVPQGAPTEATARARAFINDLGLRAHRRPLTATEADRYFALFQRGPELHPELSAFAGGVKLVVEAVLQSPFFLYRTELGQENTGGRIPLNGYEVAAKLALAVTGSGPDKILLDAAASGALNGGNVGAEVADHAERLLETPRAKATALHLHTQTYALSRYSIVQRDSNNYPEFGEGTGASLKKSAELFFQSIFDENLGVSAILTSPTAYVDANLAPFYGLGGGFGSGFSKVDLSGQGRAGFLMQLGFLTLFSGEFQPDPIHRGVFINEHVLCVDVGRPAANIPPLPDVQPGQTNRQRINAVTGPGTCGQACHATVINPLGFAFENYDPVGRYRSSDNGLPVDASGVYAINDYKTEFSNAHELAQQLGESHMAHRCYAEHWLSYLYGRLAARSDDSLLDELGVQSKSQNLSAKDIIRALVQSESFLTREILE
jgi:mono/diheme cytochrome c family protein